MIKLTIGENQGNQRLDRFLKKYFAKAPLSRIYRLIRKDVKVNGKRRNPETIVMQGDELTIYISPEEAELLKRPVRQIKAKRQFGIIYEDDNILIVSKPFGLLTHGDSREKKNHLANQVLDYLITTDRYDPGCNATFAPAPANRIDRNTTGLVIFGKNAEALKELNAMIRMRGSIGKIYMTIVSGQIRESMHLQGSMTKDEVRNRVSVSPLQEQGKDMETIITPIEISRQKGLFTLVEAEILTGRTHQIRAQLAAAGHPIIGDSKYGKPTVNAAVKEQYGLTTQLLHAYKLVFRDCRPDGSLAYLQGKEFICPMPERFIRIKEDIFG